MHQYPHHIGDFRGGTYNMTRLQRAIYRELIDVYYDKEQPLPLSLDDVCQEVGAVDESERAIVAWLLKYKFIQTVEGYEHDVCERVISEYHAKADTARLNGRKGGRPRKSEENPEKPTGFFSDTKENPEETGSQANHKPLTNNHKPESQKHTRATRFDAQAHLLSLDVSDVVARDWLALRRSKRAAPTETAIAGIAAEAAKAGISLDDALRVSCERGWQGFKADWLRNADARASPSNRDSRNDRSAAAAAIFGRSRSNGDVTDV